MCEACSSHMVLQTLTFEQIDKVAIIGLNRPAKMNAINSQLTTELDGLLDRIASNEDIWALVLKGGEKFFAAGGDLGEIKYFKTVVDGFRFGTHVQKTFSKLATLPQPTVAAVSGLALGGGCELCLACDLRIVGENASFGFPEVKVGILPGGGGTQRLSRLVGSGKAKELLFTGEAVNAQEAFRIGLVNRVVPTESVLEEAVAFAERLAGRPRFGLQTIKKLVNEGMEMDLHSALAYETRCLASLFGTEDQIEGMSAFAERRSPTFKGR